MKHTFRAVLLMAIAAIFATALIGIGYAATTPQATVSPHLVLIGTTVDQIVPSILRKDATTVSLIARLISSQQISVDRATFVDIAALQTLMGKPLAIAASEVTVGKIPTDAIGTNRFVNNPLPGGVTD